MEERERQCNGEERSDGASPTGQSAVAGEQSRASTWRNGQCVASVSTSSWFTPTFDFSHSRTLLETNGFQIPAEDFEAPLHLALDHPSVKRYLLFNSSVFNFFLAPFLYLVLWCAVYSTLHMYLNGSVANIWVLCLCVSLVSIILTATIILIFHYSNKEINMNTDVRLVGVNEHMVKHRLLLGVANWVHKCTGKLQVIAPVLNIMCDSLILYLGLLLSASLVELSWLFKLGDMSIKVLWLKVTIPSVLTVQCTLYTFCVIKHARIYY